MAMGCGETKGRIAKQLWNGSWMSIVCACACANVCTSVVCMYVYVHVCVYIYMYVCVHMCVYVCTYAFAHVRTTVRMYAFVAGLRPASGRPPASGRSAAGLPPIPGPVSCGHEGGVARFRRAPDFGVEHEGGFCYGTFRAEANER